MSVLVVSKIFRLFVNTLIPDDKYFLSNKEILSQPIQFQLCKKRNNFLKFLVHFRNLHLVLNYSKKTLSLIPYVLPIL